MNKKIFEALEISDLLNKYIRGEQSSTEEEKLREWLNESPLHQVLLTEILSEDDREKRKELIRKIDLEVEWNKLQSQNIFTKKRKLSFNFLRYAAVLLILLALGVYLYVNNMSVINNDSLVAIAPGVKKAQLVLSNGTTIELSDSIGNNEIGDENVVIKNQKQMLCYVTPQIIKKKEELCYNQLIIGRGEEYQLLLADGTKVWLNSETKLKYPVHFATNTREVELEGEAYFEVVKNPEKPFIVKTAKMDVEVLGTSFDISAYDNDNNVTATLLEGKIKVKTENEIEKSSDVILYPNDQAVFCKLTNVVRVQEVDAQRYAYWTKGFFSFDDESLVNIMKNLERWYDINVVYDNEQIGESKFSGKLPRFENCNVLLKMIEKTTNIKFEINENKNIKVSLK